MSIVGDGAVFADGHFSCPQAITDTMDGQRVGAPQADGEADFVAVGRTCRNSGNLSVARFEPSSINWLSMRAAAASEGGTLHLWRVKKVA